MSHLHSTFMLLKILLAVAALVIILIVVVATRPADFRITRSALMSASPATIQAQINNLHRWEKWSPWAKMDPAAKLTYAGAEEGPGARYAWEGNSKVGAGAMEITESQPAKLVRLRLDFRRPMQATNITEFTFVPEGEQTRVTWTMTGTNGFASKAAGLVMNIEKLVGGQFAEGLASLKSIVEAPASVPLTNAAELVR